MTTPEVSFKAMAVLHILENTHDVLEATIASVNNAEVYPVEVELDAYLAKWSDDLAEMIDRAKRSVWESDAEVSAKP